MRRLRHVPIAWPVVPLLLLFFFLALDSMVADSPTMDEQNHLTRGLTFLATGDPHFSLEHPPLINTLSALPAYLLTDVHIPLDDPSWGWRDGWYTFADRLLWQSGNDVTLVIFLARLPILFLTMGLALVGARFARELWGNSRQAALFAFAVLLFDPNLLAHGRYTTTDLGGTLFLLLAAWLLWRLWTEADWRRWLAATVALGLAFGSKLSTLSFVPIFALLAVLPLYPDRSWRGAWRRLWQYGAAGAGSLLVVWAIFGGQWANFDFQSSLLQPLNAWRGPMPTFWSGIEQILLISSGGRPSFLLGQFSDTGFPLYFPIAFLVKTPLPLLLLLPVALVMRLWRTSTRARALFLFVPAFLYFLLSIQSALNIGYRHLLPMLPFLYLLVAGIAASSPEPGGAKWPRALLGLAALSILGSTLLIHPYYLSYFNAAAGGPEQGGRILIDSNIDWGQDLIRLQEWLAANPIAHVKLSWFGTADPAYYGIPYEPLPGVPRHFDLWWNVPFDRDHPAPGLYAISVSNLGEPPLRTDEKTVFAWFRAHEPDARIGYSIYIYDVR